MFPVFSLVLDKDVKSEVAMLYPELYKDLLKVLQPSPASTPLPLLLPTTSPFFSPFISHLLLLSDGGKAAGTGGGGICAFLWRRRVGGPVETANRGGF